MSPTMLASRSLAARPRRAFLRAVAPGFLVIFAAAAVASSTVDPVDRYSWSGNLGWIDWRADGTNGAAFNDRFAGGFIWSANAGWISLGDGTPANGTSYANTSAADFGVNVDAASDPDFFLLTGFAWSANVGWISFDVAAQTGPSGRPRIEKGSGILRGSVWSANAGWLTLDSAAAVVRTGLVVPPSTGGVVIR